MKVSAVAKTIVAVVAAGVTAVVAATSDDYFTSTEMVQVAIALLAALGVYVVPNGDKGPDA